MTDNQGMTLPEQYYTSRRPTSALAIVSLVLAVTGIWSYGLGCIAAVITGHIALVRTRRYGLGGWGIALAGVIVGYAGILVALTIGVLFAVLVLNANDTPTRAETATCVRQDVRQAVLRVDAALERTLSINVAEVPLRRTCGTGELLTAEGGEAGYAVAGGSTLIGSTGTNYYEYQSGTNQFVGGGYFATGHIAPAR